MAFLCVCACACVCVCVCVLKRREKRERGGAARELKRRERRKRRLTTTAAMTTTAAEKTISSLFHLLFLRGSKPGCRSSKPRFRQQRRSLLRCDAQRSAKRARKSASQPTGKKKEKKRKKRSNKCPFLLLFASSPYRHDVPRRLVQQLDRDADALGT